MEQNNPQLRRLTQGRQHGRPGRAERGAREADRAGQHQRLLRRADDEAVEGTDRRADRRDGQGDEFYSTGSGETRIDRTIIADAIQLASASVLLARDESAGATSPTRTSVRETSSSATGPAAERAGGPNASQANHPGCGRGHTRPERAATRETNQDDSGAAPARRNRDKTIASALEGAWNRKPGPGSGWSSGCSTMTGSGLSSRCAANWRTTRPGRRDSRRQRRSRLLATRRECG